MFHKITLTVSPTKETDKTVNTNIKMQNCTRFDKIKSIFLNKDNYTFDLQKDLEKFLGWGKCSSFGNGGIRDFEELEYLLIDDIADDVKERFERQVQTISIVPDSRKTAVKIEYPLGTWGYLIDIQKDFFSFYTIEDWKIWTEPEERNMRKVETYTFNLSFTEQEIVFCMMQNLCKVVDYDRKFNELFNEYKGMFDGSEEDFLDCLIITEANLRPNGHWESIKDFPYYQTLRDKLTYMINSLPDNCKVGIRKKVESPPKWKARALFMFYRKRANESFTYQDTLAYFKCQDIIGKSNYNQLHNNFSQMERLKDRCLPTNREYIFTAIQELEKLESCKKALGIAQAEYNDFNVNYPIAIK